MARKLDAQAEFVLWWDSRTKNKGGGSEKKVSSKNSKITDNGSVIGDRVKDKHLAEGLGTSLMAISRWRRKLNTPEAFERPQRAP